MMTNGHMRRYMACGWRLAALICVLLIGGGCNSEIFLDTDDVQEDMTATIEGDGGEVTFKVSSKGLKNIGLDGLTGETLRNCTFYNENGNLITTDPDPLKISKIVYETDFRKFIITRSKDTLTFRSEYQTIQYESMWCLWFEYDYGVRTIYVTVTPGKPLKLTDVIYSGGMEINERYETKTRRTGFTNNGSIAQTLEVMPYIQETCSMLVAPTYNDSWMRGELVTMEVPKYKDGQWGLHELSDIRLGSTVTFSAPDATTKVSIEIPANSKVDVITTVTYSKATAMGTMYFLNEESGATMFDFFTATSIFPTHYEIKVEDAK